LVADHDCARDGRVPLANIHGLALLYGTAIGVAISLFVGQVDGHGTNPPSLAEPGGVDPPGPHRVVTLRR
jgi:hypothetical protein